MASKVCFGFVLAIFADDGVEKFAKDCFVLSNFTVVGMDELTLEIRVLAELEKAKSCIRRRKSHKMLT